MLFRDLLFLGSVALSFGWLAHLCISDKDFNIKTGFIFAGMLVLIGLTCYATQIGIDISIRLMYIFKLASLSVLKQRSLGCLFL